MWKEHDLEINGQKKKGKEINTSSLKITITSNNAGNIVCIVNKARPMTPVTAWGLQTKEQNEDMRWCEEYLLVNV